MKRSKTNKISISKSDNNGVLINAEIVGLRPAYHMLHFRLFLLNSIQARMGNFLAIVLDNSFMLRFFFQATYFLSKTELSIELF